MVLSLYTCRLKYHESYLNIPLYYIQFILLKTYDCLNRDCTKRSFCVRKFDILLILNIQMTVRVYIHRPSLINEFTF